MNITAVCGWALSPEWFAPQILERFPEARVRVIYPQDPADPGEARELLLSVESDLYIGFSLGALWLLKHREILPSTARGALLAPILDFVREAKKGGKIPAGQLKYLLRSLRKDPAGPVKEFYSLCGLDDSESLLKTLPCSTALIRGLEFLSETRVQGEAAGEFLTLLGDRDPLLDAGELVREIPRLEVVQGAGHQPGPLLERLSRRVENEKNRNRS